MQLDPYLNFPGNTEEAFNFYKSVLGGELTLIRFKDMPGVPGVDKMSDDVKNKIMHAALPFGNNYLMATDALKEMGQELVVGNNFYVSVTTDTADETKRIFDGLSADGKIEMPLGKTDWSSMFGMFKDKFGIQWIISINDKKE